MPLFDDDYLVSDSGAAPLASPLLEQPGIGLQPPAPVEDRNPPRAVNDPYAELKNQSGLAKLGLVLREFGAGIKGRPSPINAHMENQRKERIARVQEVEIFSKVAKETLETSELMEGDARTKYIQTKADMLDQIQAGSGDLLRSMAENPKDSKLIIEQASKSQSLKRALNVGGIRLAKRLLSTKEGQELVKKEIESGLLPHIITKLEGLALAAPELMTPDEYKKMMEDRIITPTEARILSERARGHEKYGKHVLNENELELASRYEDATYGQAGYATTKTAQEILKERAKQGGKEQKQIVEVGVGGGKFQKAYVVDGKISEKIGEPYTKSEGMTINMPGSAGFGINPETGKPGHFTIGRDSKLRWDKVEPIKKPVTTNEVVGKLIQDALGSKGGQPAAAGVKQVTQATSSVPAGIPTGSKKIGKTPDGKDVWQSRDGKKWVP